MDHKTRNRPGFTYQLWSWASLRQVNWLSLDEGALTFSVLPERGFWIRQSASRQKTGAVRMALLARGWAMESALVLLFTKPMQSIQSGLRDGSLLVGSIHSSVPPTGALFSKLTDHVTGGDCCSCIPRAGPYPLLEWKLGQQERRSLELEISCVPG